MAAISNLKILAVVALSLALGACAHEDEQSQEHVQVIRNNPGGVLVKYAITRIRYEERGYSVRFEGHCDSACTLLLGLPNSKLCVTPGASFGFHRPYGATKRGNEKAATYLYSQYPDWVKKWISSQGGLQAEINRMPFEQASAHIMPCSDSPASTLSLASSRDLYSK